MNHCFEPSIIFSLFIYLWNANRYLIIGIPWWLLWFLKTYFQTKNHFMSNVQRNYLFFFLAGTLLYSNTTLKINKNKKKTKNIYNTRRKKMHVVLYIVSYIQPTVCISTVQHLGAKNITIWAVLHLTTSCLRSTIDTEEQEFTSTFIFITMSVITLSVTVVSWVLWYTELCSALNIITHWEGCHIANCIKTGWALLLTT